MWEISWQNIQMMLLDMPYTDYSSDEDDKEEITEVTNLEQHKAAMQRLKEKRK